MIGDALVKPGEVARIPVSVSASTDTAALNLRLQYDASALTFKGVEPGPLLTASHQLFHWPPANEAQGKLNIVICTINTTASFHSQSGDVATLLFELVADVAPGASTNIEFESPEILQMPPSDLSGGAGNSLPHQRTAGRVIGDVTARALRAHLLGETQLTGQSLQRADANQDGKIDVADYLTLLKQ